MLSSSLVMVDYDDNNLKEKKEDGGPEGLRSPDLGFSSLPTHRREGSEDQPLINQLQQHQKQMQKITTT